MAFFILKELLPSLEGTEGYDENMNYIGWSSDILNDEVFKYENISDAEIKLQELFIDERYQGRKLKIKEYTE